MRTHTLSPMVSALASVAMSIGSQAAWPKEVHHRLLVPSAPSRSADADILLHQSGTSPPPALIGLQAHFTQAYPTMSANADGSDIWPCLGRSSNPDCAMVGNPPVPLPRGGIVMGRPAFTWALQNNDIIGFGLGNGTGCDAFSNGTVGQPFEPGVLYRPCGQIYTSFEDDTGDSTDDLLQRIVVRQGDNIIYDSGIQDFGPAGPIKYPVDVILFADANFGYWPGAQDGPNNGNCSGNIGYPLTAPTFPAGTTYTVASNSTCQRPVAGPATFITYTELATPEYKQINGEACTSKGVASPCFTVKWTRRYLIHQDWAIFLE
jgi:hypothetical protein